MTGAEPSGTSKTEKPASTDEVEAIRWSVRPYEKAPHKLAVVVGVATLVLLFGVVILKQSLLGGVGFAIILGSTAEWWLGTSYKVDAQGASSRCGLSVTGIAWEDVKRVIVQAGSIKLSPLGQAGTLDVFRGVTLQVTDENRERVVEAVKRFVPSHARFLEG